MKTLAIFYLLSIIFLIAKIVYTVVKDIITNGVGDLTITYDNKELNPKISVAIIVIIILFSIVMNFYLIGTLI